MRPAAVWNDHRRGGFPPFQPLQLCNLVHLWILHISILYRAQTTWNFKPLIKGAQVLRPHANHGRHFASPAYSVHIYASCIFIFVYLCICVFVYLCICILYSPTTRRPWPRQLHSSSAHIHRFYCFTGFEARSTQQNN